MRRHRRALAVFGGGLGALVAFVLAKAARPFLPIPSGGIGFVTVHQIPKSIDTLRFALLLVLIPLGSLAASRGGIEESPSPGLRPPSPTGGEGRSTGPRLVSPLLFLAVLALRFFYSSGIHGPIDLFHAGHYLSPAADALAGKSFYREALPFHGLVTDGGLDAAAFRIFGETLAVSRSLRIALDLCFFAVALVLFRRLLPSIAAYCAGVGLLVFLTSAFRLDSSFPYFRTLPLLLGASFAALAIQTGRRRFALAAGASAGLGVFWSLDSGLFSLAALLGWLAVDAFSVRRLDLRRLAACTTGVALGLLPGFAFLVAERSVASFFAESWTVLRSMDALWGLPAPAGGDLWRSLRLGPIGFLEGDAAHFYFPIVFFGSAVAWLCVRRRDGRFGKRERTVVALLVFSVVAYRTALGRSSYSHTRFSMVVPALLLAFLVAPIFERRPGRSSLAGIAALVIVVAIFAEVVPAVSHGWTAIRSFSPRWRGDGLRAVDLPRWGKSRTVPEQASSLEALARFTAAGKASAGTFYDFSNSGALYFFLDRRNPTRVYEASCLSAGDFERDAIADLARARPAFVVVNAPGGQDFDDVPNGVRAPKMAAWIRESYPREITVGGFVVRVP